MAIKVYGGNHGIATANVLPSSSAEALDIESTDGKDYIVIDTLNETMKIGSGSGTSDVCKVSVGANPGTVGEVFRVRQSYTADSLALIENTGAGIALDVSSGTTSASVDVMTIKNGTGTVAAFGADAETTLNGPVGIRESAITNHWTGARDLVVKGADTAGITLRAASSTYGTSIAFADADGTAAQGCGGVIQYIHNGDYARLYAKYNGDGASANASGEHVIRYNEYGMGKMRCSTAYDSTARDSATNTSRPVYLATTSSTNDTLVIDYEHGTVGEITLTNNITAIKFFNAPRHGSAQTMTVKIKQASSAVTFSYSSVTIYWNTAATKAGNLLWSGGVSHTLSTGNNEIDIVQFTCLPHGDTNRDIYASVIGQNFS
jgi:hypothetical protein